MFFYLSAWMQGITLRSVASASLIVLGLCITVLHFHLTITAVAAGGFMEVTVALWSLHATLGLVLTVLGVLIRRN